MKVEFTQIPWNPPVTYQGHTIEISTHVHTWGSYIGQWSGSMRVMKERTVLTEATVSALHQSAAHAETDTLRVAKIYVDELGM